MTSELITKLQNTGIITFGRFELSSGLISPIYFDNRKIMSNPELLHTVAKALVKEIQNSNYVLCPVPYGAIPLCTAMSLFGTIPMITCRKEAKKYGTKQMIEGVWKKYSCCTLIEDTITTGTF